MYINEEEIYAYDPMRKPIWEINGFKYGDWTPSGTFTKFLEFPISQV